MMPQKDTLAAWLFHQGTNFESWKYLGVHGTAEARSFRVWAPEALSVTLSGDFCGWQEDPALAFSKISEGGVWELVTDRVPDGALYKYVIGTQDGRKLWKADPYAFYAEKAPGTASVVYSCPENYEWQDAKWLENRPSGRDYSRPLNIYEVHAGSWIRHEDGSRTNWRELADELAVYVKSMGYTHVELMPVTQHPFEGSWGYQVTGYFAPDSRLGTPEDFCCFVNTLHCAGVGVILDWVPGHFPKDSFGLCEFDGSCLYEYKGADRMENAGWGTRCFDLGRNEVESFLISDAAFWAEVYHADGLRVDAVSSMLYLDYGRKPGEWFPNEFGDNRNFCGISFFKKLNAHMNGRFPQLMMIAEESTSFENVTKPSPEGLGFTHKWNMGWMNDTLSYKSLDPLWRRDHHSKLTFSMCYAFSENFILPVSHDEVVHGKKTLLDRTPGDYRQKFADTRAYMLYMMCHPGKKLSFMGNEIGQFAEWNYEKSVEWFLLGYDTHRSFQHFCADLNNLYLRTPELWQRDDSWDGFEWIDADNKDQSVISFRRMSDSGEVLVVINFSAEYFPAFRVGVPAKGEWRQLISSDECCYGGGGVSHSLLKASEKAANGRPYSVNLRLAPMSGIILKKVNRRKKSNK